MVCVRWIVVRQPRTRLAFAPILKRRAALSPSAFVFGSSAGAYVESFKTAWESLLLLANGHDTKRAKPGARVDRKKLRQIDLHWHDPMLPVVESHSALLLRGYAHVPGA